MDQDIPLTLEVATWKTITLPLSAFTGASQRESCLPTVDSIAFIVVPGSALAGTQIAERCSSTQIRPRQNRGRRYS